MSVQMKVLSALLMCSMARTLKHHYKRSQACWDDSPPYCPSGQECHYNTPTSANGFCRPVASTPAPTPTASPAPIPTVSPFDPSSFDPCNSPADCQSGLKCCAWPILKPNGPAGYCHASCGGDITTPAPSPPSPPFAGPQTCGDPSKDTWGHQLDGCPDGQFCYWGFSDKEKQQPGVCCPEGTTCRKVPCWSSDVCNSGQTCYPPSGISQWHPGVCCPNGTTCKWD